MRLCGYAYLALLLSGRPFGYNVCVQAQSVGGWPETPNVDTYVLLQQQPCYKSGLLCAWIAMCVCVCKNLLTFVYMCACLLNTVYYLTGFVG